MEIEVRATTPDHRPSVLDLVRSAFSNDTRAGREEVSVVARTWALGGRVSPIDLVAVDGQTVVGHVLGARGALGGRSAIGIAPLAVAPSHQGRGIGARLMLELLKIAENERWAIAVLLGSPAYYERFGFQAAAPLGISYPPAGDGNPHFQARRLGCYDSSYRGLFRYCWE